MRLSQKSMHILFMSQSRKYAKTSNCWVINFLQESGGSGLEFSGGDCTNDARQTLLASLGETVNSTSCTWGTSMLISLEVYSGFTAIARYLFCNIYKTLINFISYYIIFAKLRPVILSQLASIHNFTVKLRTIIQNIHLNICRYWYSCRFLMARTRWPSWNLSHLSIQR